MHPKFTQPVLALVAIIALCLLHVPAILAQPMPGPATEAGDEVTIYPDVNFGGTKMTLLPQSDPQSLNMSGINYQNNVASIVIPLGLMVTLYDGNSAHSPAYDLKLFPGNYPDLGNWRDRAEFMKVERIAVDTPIVYLFDEEGEVGRPYIFQGFGPGDYDAGPNKQQLIKFDGYEYIIVKGLVEAVVFNANGLNGQSETYIDNDGLGTGAKLEPAWFDRVRGVRVTSRSEKPAQVAAGGQSASSDYYAGVNFTVTPPNASLCGCGNESIKPPQSVTITREGKELAQRKEGTRTTTPWTGELSVPVGPGRKDYEATLNYDAGSYASDCTTRCGYTYASQSIKLSTADLRAPVLDSFAVTPDGGFELHWKMRTDVPDDQIVTRVKRDGRLIATLIDTARARTYTTKDFPGFGPYEYTIEIEAFGQRATSKPLELYPPVGLIEGTVATKPGVSGSSAGVEGVTVCATLENNLPGRASGARNCATTEADGRYRIDNLYYGEEAKFRIEPSKEGHGFDPNFITRTLTPRITVERNVNFTDTTSFVVSGRVVQVDGLDTCGVAGAELLINGNNLGNVTSHDGTFDLVMPQAGKYTITPQLGDHVFSPARQELTVAADVMGLIIEDETRRTLSGYVRAGCEQYLGTATVRVFTADKCLVRETTTSADSGYYAFELPARPFRVEISNVVAAPGYDGGEIEGFFGEARDIDLSDQDSVLLFTYRNPPTIVISDLESSCYQDLPILEQHTAYNLDITVWEEVNVCPVDTGVLIITDAISDRAEPIRLPIQNGRVRYSIEAGEPNIVGPYTKGITFTAEVEGREATVTQQAIVTGVRAREKTFATVSPELPLLILRDPPGDASYSYLGSDATIQSAMSFSAKRENTTNVWTKLKVGAKFEVGFGYVTEFSVWGDLKASMSIGASSNRNEELLTEITTTERFSTSNNEAVTGAEGDVFIGAAMNIIYALADELIFDPNGCTLETDVNLIMGNDGFATTYIYTEDHIRNVLIPELNRLIVLNQTANPDTVAHYQNQVSVWQQTLQRNNQLKADANFVENKSFSALAPYDASTSATSTHAMTIEFMETIDAEVAAETGMEVAGVGFSGGVQTTFRMQMGQSQSNSVTKSTVTGFHLSDDDQGDYFSVDIKTDPVYSTPVFDLVSGRSSCPHEPGTQPRDDLRLLVEEPVATDVDPNGQAVFKLRILNVSQSEETRTYRLSFNQASNPDGARVRLGGSEIQGSIPYTVPYNNQAEATVTIERGPNAFTYRDLEFRLSSDCDNSIYRTVKLSAYFQNDCSPINLTTPETEWVVSTADADLQTVRLTNYEKDKLNRVIIQYAATGTNVWETIRTLQPGDLSDLPGGTEVSLDLGELPDGNYQLRARLNCDQGYVFSESVAGRVDRTGPKLFGVPEPADGEYSRGDVLSAAFNEAINCMVISAEDVTLTRTSDGTIIPTSVGCSDRQLLFRPDQNLFDQNGERFTLTVRDVQDLYGNPLAEPLEWSFTIGSDNTGEESTDDDGDGVLNTVDNCSLAANPEQGDLDKDGIGDACDDDIDGDGVANEVDNAPYYKNPDQTDSDNNGVGDVAEPDGDGDGDGVANATDNCASISNADQNDLDKDGIGDACDEDRDGDGVRNDLDICPDVANPLQDSSTVVNSTSCLVAVAEIELFDFLHVYPNPASDQLFVELLPARPGRLAVELYDPTGKRLYRTEVEATRQAMTLRLPVDHLPRGVYYLRLADGQRSIGRKVVIH